MLSTIAKFTKILFIEVSVGLLVLFAFVGITPAYAAEVLPVYQHASEAAAESGNAEVLPVYQFVNDASEANAGVPIAEVAASTEVLPVYEGNAAVALEASHASGVQPMGIEGAPLLHAANGFSVEIIVLAGVAIVALAMTVAIGIFRMNSAKAVSNA